MKPMNVKQAKDVMAAHLMTVAFSSAHADPEVVMAWNMMKWTLAKALTFGWWKPVLAVAEAKPCGCWLTTAMWNSIL